MVIFRRGLGRCSVGAAGETCYSWSARELVLLPRLAKDGIRIVNVDEDLLFVFRVDHGWLLVCETSIRRFVEDVQTDRVDLGEVIELAEWKNGILYVHDASGSTVGVSIDGGAWLF